MMMIQASFSIFCHADFIQHYGFIILPDYNAMFGVHRKKGVISETGL